MNSYTVWAYSPSLNEEHRLFDLADTTPYTTLAEAERDAEAFAREFNRVRKQHATDWQPRIKEEAVGITTIPGYLFHTGK